MYPSNFKSQVSITHITTATALLEVDGLNFITDPVFNDAPNEYDVSNLLPRSAKKVAINVTEGPKLSIKQLPIIHCVLLSHEDHVDNLDDSGRQLLISRVVITTPDGAKNLAEYPATRAIRSWETLNYRWEDEDWSITGVPGVHLPGGEVTGFIIHKPSFGVSPDGKPNVIYFTGDTILLEDEVAKIREKYHVVIALMNLGQAMIPWEGKPDGLLQITMGGRDAADMFRRLGADVLVPMHYESWTHFTQDGEALRDIFQSEGVLDKVIWLKPNGENTPIIQ